MEPDWLTKLKQIHALAESGQAFHADDFDAQRYCHITQLCQQLLHQFTDIPVDALQLALSLEPKRYVTPQVAVRAAVFDGERILLVQEKADNCWTLPGGYADVGESATETAIKEVREEAGLEVKIRRLISLRHKAKGPYPADVRDFYHIHFLCESHTEVQPTPGMETLDAAYFPLDALPPLSAGRTAERDIRDAYQVMRSPDMPVLLD